MKNSKIMIINAELVYFKNRTTGKYDNEFTKINYSIPMSKNENLVGNALLVCFKQGNILEKLKNLCGKESIANIEEQPTENGSKYVIRSINGIDL